MKQLQVEVKEAKEDLEDLGSQTLTVAEEARQGVQEAGKTAQEAVEEIKSSIQSLHLDLAAKITYVAVGLLGGPNNTFTHFHVPGSGCEDFESLGNTYIKISLPRYLP